MLTIHFIPVIILLKLCGRKESGMKIKLYNFMRIHAYELAISSLALMGFLFLALYAISESVTMQYIACYFFIAWAILLVYYLIATHIHKCKFRRKMRLR